MVRSDYGLPYSKGLMAQSIMATGLPPERSFALARLIEERLGSSAHQAEVSVEELRALAEEVLLAEEGETVTNALPAVVAARAASTGRWSSCSVASPASASRRSRPSSPTGSGSRA